MAPLPWARMWRSSCFMQAQTPLGQYRPQPGEGGDRANEAKVCLEPTRRLGDAHHTAGTVLLNLGVPNMVVDAIMGWEPGKSARMRRRYQHLTGRVLRDTADKVGGLLWGAKPDRRIKFPPIAFAHCPDDCPAPPRRRGPPTRGFDETVYAFLSVSRCRRSTRRMVAGDM